MSVIETSEKKLEELTISGDRKSNICKLIEFSEKNNEEQPDFTTLNNVGEIECEVKYKNFKCVGKGETEDIAKEDAAQKMLNFLNTPNNLMMYCLDEVTVCNKSAEELLPTQSNTTKSTSEINAIGSDVRAGSVGEGGDSNNQNSVGFLQEYAIKHKLSFPIYHCSIAGGCFVVQCNFMNMITSGNALNKKVAKRISAQKMIEEINQRQSEDFFNDLTKGKITTVNCNTESRDNGCVFEEQGSNINREEQLGVNFIGMVQEYATNKKKALPVYEFSASGASHNPVFKATCTFDGMTETSLGKNKKQAKTEAAHKMWIRCLNRDESIKM